MDFAPLVTYHGALVRRMTLILALSLAAPAAACDLARAVQRYWADLKVGDMVETETRVTGEGHRSVVTLTAEVVTEKETLVLRVTERTEGEADSGPGGGPKQKVSLSSGSTFVLAPPAKMIETRWTFDGDKPTAPRTEAIELTAAANRLPGLPAYCVEGAGAAESVETPAGTFNARAYTVQESKLWLAAEVPFGGLVKTVATGGGEKLESVVTKVRKGNR